MDQRTVSLAALLPGLVALSLFFGVAAASLLALAEAGAGMDVRPRLGPLLHIAGFTLFQAALSTLCSVIPGMAVARAIARRPNLPFRETLLRLLGLPLVLPVIVAILGLASVLGSAGPVAAVAGALGWVDWSFPYGLTGILIGHAFFNLPLTARLLAPTLEAVPVESWRGAAQLGMSSWQVFRHIEWPHLRRAMPGVSGLVFVLCFTSFAVVLVFGGGPWATTLEVAIYQSLRLEFNLDKAVMLAFTQIALCAAVLLLVQRFVVPVPLDRGAGNSLRRPDVHSGFWIDGAVVVAAALLVAAPLLAVALRALTGDGIGILASNTVWMALLRSCLVGGSAGLLALLMGWCIALAARDLRRSSRWRRLAEPMENLTGLNLIVSPVVLGAGLFVLLLPLGVVFDLALPLACAVNAMVTVPYVVRVLSPPMQRIAEHYDRSCHAMGIVGWNRARLVEWPLLRRDVGRALALATGVSLGDLAAIALFGSESSTTLPLLLYRLMASYRMEEAAVVAVLLTLLCFASFAAIERAVGGRRAGG